MNIEMIPLRESQDAVRFTAMLFSALGFLAGAIASAVLL